MTSNHSVANTTDMLSQSRDVLYGPQNLELNDHLDIRYSNENENENGVSQNSASEHCIGNGDVYSQFNQKSTVNQSVTGNQCAVNNEIPPWAVNICAQLQNIQSQTQSIQTQLETQDTRWHRVETQLANQSTRMNQIEAQISQFNALQQKVADTDRNIASINTEVYDIKTKVEEYDRSIHYYSQVCDDIIHTNTDINSKVDDLFKTIASLEKKQCELSAEQTKTNEKLTDVQWRSMRENLIFYGIPESELNRGMYENCELIIKNFIRMEMNINKDIQFDRVHRLGRYSQQQRYPRPIVAKFTYYKDKELVRLNAPKTLINSSYVVKEQFPAEMEEKRKLLYGEAKRARQNANNKVRLVRDKLYVNGQEVIPPSEAPRRYTGHAANRPSNDNSTGATGRQQNQQTRTQNKTQVQHGQPRRGITGQQRQYSPTLFQQQSQAKRSASSATTAADQIPNRQNGTPARSQVVVNGTRNVSNQGQLLTPTQNHQREIDPTPRDNILTNNRFPPWFGEEHNQSASDRQPSLAGKRKPTSPVDSDIFSKRQNEYTTVSDKTNNMECEQSQVNGSNGNGEFATDVSSTHL